MVTATPDRLSARERLLDAADELFYEEGVNTVGIDRVIERAGVAKATLYNAFGSKEELVRAYLARRHQRRSERITVALRRYSDPRQRLLGVFDVLGESFLEPGYHGCAFANASVEARPGSAVVGVADEYRAWVRSLFVDLGAAAGARDPERLAGQLVLLYDGAGMGARMDRDPGAAAAARAIAEVLLDAAIDGPASASGVGSSAVTPSH
ncbi:MAG: TetR/AcrR family transcriptional regulator [Frankiales bacterium]|jgi:AcrR family transcriptional regulator|nr:TetR/AcrR family transcriptional regulator [Frankiales bacterium]